MLTLPNNTGLTPQVFGHDKTAGLIVMDWVLGKTLTQVLTSDTVATTAPQIGTWLTVFATRMQAVATQGDWFSYLSHYDEFDLGDALTPHRTRLQAISFSIRTIARNDAFADNFIARPDGGLAGIDFESA